MHEISKLISTFNINTIVLCMLNTIRHVCIVHVLTNLSPSHAENNCTILCAATVRSNVQCAMARVCIFSAVIL